MRRSLGIGSILALAVPLLAQADRTEENRKLLEKWRQDPTHLTRLRHDLGVFLQYSPEHQQRLRQFERDLHEENPALARMGRVLEALCRLARPSSRSGPAAN